MRGYPTLVMAGLFVALSLTNAAAAEPVRLKVAVSHPILLSGKKQTAYLKVGLAGLKIATGDQRAPVNVAIVLDRSGSMSGEKIRKAKEAAILAIDRLDADDIVSVVAYNQGVNVLVPATKVRDKHALYTAINRLHAGGSTALFAGVSKGAHEVRKFLSAGRVNRVVLLSDGLANVGPSSPESLAALGSSLIKEGISVTTIGLGLGYNEDLMFRLAHTSEGNHVFVESSQHLARIFSREFGDLLSAVANQVEVEIVCAEGIRPVRVLGHEANIAGPRVTTRLNQLFGGQEKYVLLEVEVTGHDVGQSMELAAVNVGYAHVMDKGSGQLTGSAGVTFTGSARTVESSADAAVMVAVVEQIAADNNIRAMQLRDQGKVAEARKVLLRNEKYLNDNARVYRSPALKRWSQNNAEDARNLAPKKWKKRRKMMRMDQYEMMH